MSEPESVRLDIGPVWRLDDLRQEWDERGVEAPANVFVLRTADGVEITPAWALDDQLQPRPAITDLVELMADAESWMAAAWLCAPDDLLEGRRPVDVTDDPVLMSRARAACTAAAARWSR